MNKQHIRRRILAAFIDYSLIFTINFCLIFILGKPINDSEGTYELKGLLLLITILPWIVFILCTEYFLGSTIGNAIVGLKPVPYHDKGGKITFMQCLQRHILDVVDMAFFGLVGILVMKHNPDGQRLGDIWAKTLVVMYRK